MISIDYSTVAAVPVSYLPASLVVCSLSNLYMYIILYSHDYVCGEISVCVSACITLLMLSCAFRLAAKPARSSSIAERPCDVVCR